MYRPRPTTLGFATLALAIGLAGCSTEPDRDDSGAITETGELDAFSIEVGDCLNNPVEGEDSGEFFSVDAVPCDQPHDMEAFSLFDLESGPFPGDEEVGSKAADRCIDDFEDYVGESYSESIYVLNWFSPTLASWEQGDQEIVCLIDGTVDGDRLEGSVEGLAFIESDDTERPVDAEDAGDAGGMTSDNAGSSSGMTNRGSDGGTDSEGFELGVFSLDVGNCLNDPTSDGVTDEFSSVTIVPCDQVHDMEAYWLFDMPSGPFPGDDGISVAASEGCTFAFETYVGLSYEESIYLVSWFNPTAESWQLGDQEIVCLIVGTVDGDSLQGNALGTGV